MRRTAPWINANLSGSAGPATVIMSSRLPDEAASAWNAARISRILSARARACVSNTKQEGETTHVKEEKADVQRGEVLGVLRASAPRRVADVLPILTHTPQNLPISSRQKKTQEKRKPPRTISTPSNPYVRAQSTQLCINVPLPSSLLAICEKNVE